jgi:hypothetical protein
VKREAPIEALRATNLMNFRGNVVVLGWFLVEIGCFWWFMVVAFIFERFAEKQGYFMGIRE